MRTERKQMIRESVILGILLFLIIIADINYTAKSEYLSESETVAAEEEDFVVSIEDMDKENVMLSNGEDTEKEESTEDLQTSEQVDSTEELESTEEIETESEEEAKYVTTPYIIEATAYIATGNPCRNGEYPIVGVTVAGMYEWLGRHCNLYYCNEDGTIGEYMGTYIFMDTGFGHDPDGDGRGSIQTGERIDIFMASYDEAMDWGVRNVYIEFLD